MQFRPLWSKALMARFFSILFCKIWKRTRL